MRTLRAAALMLAAIALVGWVDYVTGPDYGLSLFYLLPVAAAGLWLGPWTAATGALAAAAAWFWADVVWYPADHLRISTWNGLTRLVIFLFTGIATARLREDRSELMRLNERLRVLLEREQALSRTDGLTELANARAFRERLASELPRLRRKGSALCVAYLDVDNFKEVNDRFGHAAGDELLRRVAALVRLAIRAGDLPARIGGDEFVIALWDVARADAQTVALRLASRIHELGADYPGVALGASIGIAIVAEPSDDLDVVMRAADTAMYAAKSAGKGRVAVSVDHAAPVLVGPA